MNIGRGAQNYVEFWAYPAPNVVLDGEEDMNQ